jgi:cutinase
MRHWQPPHRVGLRRAARSAVVLAVACPIAFTCLSALSSAAAQPVAHLAQTCTSVDFVGARGSGESLGSYEGFGQEVYAMDHALASKLQAGGLSLASTPVDDGYQAASTNELDPSRGEEALAVGSLTAAVLEWKKNQLDPFLNSIKTGTTAVLAYVNFEIAHCPSSVIVLAGYSQGAMAVHQAELQMSRSVLSHIGGTILLADGDRVPNTAAAETLGSSPADGEGVRSYLHMNSLQDVPMPESTVDVCNTHDIVCDFTSGSILHVGRDTRVHTTYGSGQLPQQAANWVAQRIVSEHRVLPSPSPSFAPGASFDDLCVVAWPTAPVRTANAIEMTMSCQHVPESEYLFTDVSYGDPNLAITPDTPEARVIGRVVGTATSDLGYKELLVAASSVVVQGSG